MRDAVGNKIKEQDLVRWNIPPELMNRMVFQVVRVNEGGIVTPQGTTPPTISVTVTLPIQPDPNNRGGEPLLSDFVCVRNPESENLLDAITGGKPQ